MSTESQGPLIRLKPAYIVGAALLLHCLLIVRTLPLSVAFCGDPFGPVDSVSYFAQAHAVRQIFHQSHHFWGYQPYFDAGNRVGLWQSTGKKVWELWLALWPFHSEVIGFAACYYVFVLLTPLLPVLIGKRIGLTSEALAGVLLFSVGVWHLDSQISYNWQIGGVMRFAACGLVGLLLVELTNCLQADRHSFFFAIYLGILSATIFWIHPTEMLSAVCGCGFAGLLNWRQLRGRRIIVLGCALAVSILLSGIWMWPLLHSHEPSLAPPDIQAWPGYATWKNAVMDFFSDRGFRHPFDRRAILQLTFVMTGAFWMTKSSVVFRKHLGTLCLTAGALLILAYTSPLSPQMWHIQPYRYLNSAIMLCVLPAALGIRESYLVLVKLWNQRSSRFSLGAVLILLLPPFTAYLVDITTQRPLETISSSRKQVVSYVARLPQEQGRILVDDHLLGSILPFYTKQEVLGGPKGGFRPPADGVEGELLFNKPLEFWNGKSLEDYLILYDVRYLILCGGNVVQFAKSYPGLFKETRRIDDYHVFQVMLHRPGLVYEGSAEVKADYNQIQVNDIKPGRVILKYHYDRNFVATNGVRIKPVYLFDDPAPFISFWCDGSFDSLLITLKY